ncbi:adhesin [Citrobacter amalonaticus]|uniref:adhesin n=1 Tax=Citrobacter amalonaticus TaxID=35703 RepID=UPI0039785D75
MKKNKLLIGVISALLISGSAAAAEKTSVLTASGSFDAQSCTVSMPETMTADFGHVTNAQVNNAKAMAKIATQDAGSIQVSNCTTPASLTVTTTNSNRNNYVYPAMDVVDPTEGQQKDFALWLKANNKDVTLTKAFALDNGTYPLTLELVKMTSNFNKNRTGGWSATYTLNVTYS